MKRPIGSAEAESAGHISRPALRNIRRWLTEAPFAKYRPRLLEDIAQGRWAELDDAFFAVLEFGTGGRRGKMYPVGTNVLNERTIAESARGLADYVTAKKGADSRRTCVIARDTRHHSAEFAELCASRARGRRLPGLPLPRLPFHPPALLCRPTSPLRRRHHDHRVA